MTLGNKIKQIRKDCNLTIQDVAVMANITTGMISQIENDKANPSLSTLLALSRALSTDITDFFDGIQEKPENQPLVRVSNRAQLGKSGGWVTVLLSPPHLKWFHVAHSSASVGCEPRVYNDQSKKERTGYEMAYVISGKFTIKLNDVLYVLNPGDTLTYPIASNRITTYIGKDDGEILWIHIPCASAESEEAESFFSDGDASSS